MTTELTLTLRVTIDGHHAEDVLAELAIDANSGELDLALLNLLRAHFRRIWLSDDRDWRIVSARCDVPEVTS